LSGDADTGDTLTVVSFWPATGEGEIATGLAVHAPDVPQVSVSGLLELTGTFVAQVTCAEVWVRSVT